MGKLRSPSRKERRHRRHLGPVAVLPAGLSSIDGEPGDLESEQIDLAAMKDGLREPLATEREAACLDLARLFGDPQFDAQKFQDQIGALSLGYELFNLAMNDPELQVRVEAAGALRNLLIMGEEWASRDFIGKGLLDNFAVLLESTAARALSSLPSTEPAAKLQRSLMEQLLAIAWCLCEESGRAVTRFTQASLMRCILEFLDYQRIDESLCLTAAHCVCTLTEDNPQCLDYFASSAGLLTAFTAAVTSNVHERFQSGYLFQSLLAIVICNLHGVWSIDDPVHHFMPVIETILVFDPRRDVTIVQNAMKPLSDQGDAAADARIRDDVYRLKCAFNSQQLILELLANLATSPEEAVTEGAERDTTLDDQDEDLETTGDAAEALIGQSAQVAFWTPRLIELILEKSVVRASEYEAVGLPQANPVLAESWRRVQLRALGCLNNLLIVLAPATIEHLVSVVPVPVLVSAFELLNLPTLSGFEVESLEYLTNVIICLAQRAGGAIDRLFPTVQNAEMFASVTRRLIDSNVESLVRNGLVMLGICGSSPQLAAVRTEIGQLLFDFLHHESISLAMEAANSLMDVFGVDGSEACFDTLNGLVRLREALPGLQARLTRSRQQIGRDAAATFSEIILNLKRFIKYKSR